MCDFISWTLDLAIRSEILDPLLHKHRFLTSLYPLHFIVLIEWADNITCLTFVCSFCENQLVFPHSCSDISLGVFKSLTAFLSLSIISSNLNLILYFIWEFMYKNFIHGCNFPDVLKEGPGSRVLKKARSFKDDIKSRIARRTPSASRGEGGDPPTKHEGLSRPSPQHHRKSPKHHAKKKPGLQRGRSFNEGSKDKTKKRSVGLPSQNFLIETPC